MGKPKREKGKGRRHRAGPESGPRGLRDSAAKTEEAPRFRSREAYLAVNSGVSSRNRFLLARRAFSSEAAVCVPVAAAARAAARACEPVVWPQALAAVFVAQAHAAAVWAAPQAAAGVWGAPQGEVGGEVGAALPAGSVAALGGVLAASQARQVAQEADWAA